MSNSWFGRKTFVTFLFFGALVPNLFAQSDLHNGIGERFSLGTEVSSSNQQIEHALQLHQLGMFEQSWLMLQRWRDDRPDFEPLALTELGNYAWAWNSFAQDPQQGAPFLERFVQRYPNSSYSDTLLIQLGHFASKKERYDQAIDHYRDALDHQLEPEVAAEVYYWMAEAAASNDQLDRARDIFLELADTYSESEWSPKALYARGRLFLSELNYEASTQAFELLRERYPNDPMTRRIGTALGESYYQEKNYQQAITAFQDAMPYLEGDQRAKAVYLIAESYNVLNNYDRASRYYLQYIRQYGDSDRVRNAHYGLAWVYHKQNIYHWAADAFAKATEGNDQLARKALYYKSVNEKLGGRYDKALQTFQEFGDQYQEGFWVEEVYYEWAVTAFEMGRHTKAIDILLQLIRGDTQLQKAGKVYTLLGEAYFANGEYTRALAAFDEAEQQVNVDPVIKRQARFQKAWVQYRNQAYQSAQPIFERIYQEAPDTDIGGEALFWSADSYYQLEDWGPAGARFARFLEEYPDHDMAGAAKYALGWSHFEMRRFDQAIEPFKSFLESYDPPPIALFPYDTDTQLRIGDAYYATKKYRQAITYYNKAIGAEPGGDYAMFQVANSYYRADRSYEAVRTFRKLLRIYPYSHLREQAQYNIGYIYFLTGNYTQAINEFKTLINKYPGTTWAARSQYNIGDAHYNAGDYKQAIAAYKQVLQDYPRSEYIIEAVNGIQYAQLAAGQPDSSSVILEEFLAQHPRASTADRLRYRKAENLLQAGDYPGAIKAFRQYIRVTNSESKLPDAYYNLADAYHQQDNMVRAQEAYQTIVDQYPNSERAAPTLAILGDLALEKGDTQQAQAYFQQLLDNYDRLELEAILGLGRTSLAAGNYDQAESYYQRVLRLREGNDEAEVGLGVVAQQRGRLDQAIEYFSSVAESNTINLGAEAQYRLGRVYQQEQRFNKAIEAYSNVKVLYEAYDQWVSKALFHSAECHLQLGNRGEARSLLESVTKSYPNLAVAKRAQQMLEQL
jgi:tetratricopeptide (TPR) repeat protein